MFRPHRSLIKSEAQGVGSGHQNFLKFSQMILTEAKAERVPLALGSNDTSQFSCGPVLLIYMEFYVRY